MALRKTGDRWNYMLPGTREKVAALETLAAHNGLLVMFWDGWRDPADTLKNIAAGTSKVTDAFGSLHTWGLAFDMVFIGPLGEPVWLPDTDPRWKQLAQLGESIGLKSGGIMWGWDWPHFQMPGFSYSALKYIYDTDYETFLSERGVMLT